MTVANIAGSDLSACRRALGLSRAGLAARLGFRLADVTRWERGEAAPTPAELAVLAEAMGFDSIPSERPATSEGDIPDLPSGNPGDVFSAAGAEVTFEPRREDFPESAAVFPTAGRGGAAAAIVYSDGVVARAPREWRRYALRRTLTWTALAAMGAGLWWAVSRLGPSLGEAARLLGL